MSENDEDDEWDDESVQSFDSTQSTQSTQSLPEFSLFNQLLKDSKNAVFIDEGMVLCVDKKVEDVEVRIIVKTNHIKGQTALAWGLEKDSDIEFVIDFTFRNTIIKEIKPNSKVKFQINSIASSYWKDVKDVKDIKLVNFIKYMYKRIFDLHMHCIICDKLHEDNLQMINPTICMNPLCMYSAQLCKEFLEDFDMGGGIRGGQIKLLRLFFVMAVMSERCDKILSPWPIVFNANQEILIDKNTTIPEIRKIVNEFKPDPIICENCKPNCIKCSLETWVITSNRSSILSLQDYQRCEDFKTEHQYLLISNPPEMEEKFQNLKKKHGSKFFYHGSPTDNWHSILRNGFFIASGTPDFQLHGAAYGIGVYVAHNMDTASGYTRIMSKNFNKDYRVDDEFKIMFVAVCEVINDFDVVKDHGWCKVVPDANYIVPRFILGYSDYPKNKNIPDSTSEKIDKWCRDIMKEFN